MSPTLHRQIGNFPQAFSHLALVTSAQIIESAVQQRPFNEPARGYGTLPTYH